MIRGAIFDMDGVLVDNRDAHLDAFVALCRRYGVEMERDHVVPFFGRGNDEILPEVLPAEVIRRVGLEELDREKEEIYRELYANRIEPVAGLDRFLRALKGEGVRLAVGSSGMKLNVDFVIEKCGFGGLFDAVVNGEMVSRRKPEPDIFLACASMMGLTPRDCVVFEDSFAGIEAARRAGMKVVALSTTFSDERLRTSDNDLIIKDFSEITPATLRTI